MCSIFCLSRSPGRDQSGRGDYSEGCWVLSWWCIEGLLCRHCLKELKCRWTAADTAMRCYAYLDIWRHYRVEWYEPHPWRVRILRNDQGRWEWDLFDYLSAESWRAVERIDMELLWDGDDGKMNGLIEESGPCRVTDTRSAIGNTFDGDVGW